MRTTLVLSFLVGGSILFGTIQPSRAGEALVGGYSEVSVTNEQVIAAAQFFVKTLNALSERETNLSLVEILSAEQQVVAGMNYRLRLTVKVDGELRQATVVVWRKLSGEYELTSWTWRHLVQR